MANNLNYLLAETESWSKFIEFNLPIENVANYKFINLKNELYIELFNKMINIIENVENYSKDYILTVARGLSLYSLGKTSNYFYSINKSLNLLYASSLYYITDFSASAYLLCNSFSIENYESDINKFLFGFLSRRTVPNNRYYELLINYFNTGNIDFILQLKNTFVDLSSKMLEKLLDNDSIDNYISSKILTYILDNFINNNLISDILAYSSISDFSIWKRYIQNNIYSKLPIWDFFPSQREAIKKELLKTKKSFSLQMPTSAGKTALCELIIYNEIKSNPDAKILFLAPFRALASELKGGFCTRLSKLGVKTKTMYGGNIVSIEEKKQIENINLLITTPEKLIALETSFNNFLSKFSIIICDEGHIIDNDKRGLSYELLLAKIKSLNRDNKFIFLSAIIPTITEINQWLGGDSNSIVASSYRPTKLTYSFLNPMQTSSDKNAYFLNVNPLKERPYNYQLYNFLSKSDFQYINNKTGRKKTLKKDNRILSILSALKSLPAGGSVAIFTPTKDGKQGVLAVANALLKDILEKNINLPNPLEYSESKELVEELKDYFSKIFGNDFILTKLSKYACSMHYGNLPQNVREIIETYTKNNAIKLLICNTTLAEGVNLPIKTLIIYNTVLYFDKGNKFQRKIKNSDLKNIIGRAGRAGKEIEGFVIVINKNDFENVESIIKNTESEEIKGYLFYIIERITKALQGRQLSEKLLDNQSSEEFLEYIDVIDFSLINLLPEDSDEEKLNEIVSRLIENTFAHFLAKEKVKETLNDLLNIRKNKIKRLIIENEFIKIKSCGCNIRLFHDINKFIDFTNEMWVTLDDPSNTLWIEYLTKSIYSLPQTQYFLNKNKFTNDIVEKLEKVILYWINGYWYHQIANELKIDINYLLYTFKDLIEYHFTLILSFVTRLAEQKFNENSIAISDIASNWSKFLLYGLNTNTQLLLVDLGFNERIGIINLDNWFVNKKIQINDINFLKNEIIGNKDLILNELNSIIPRISLEKIEKTIEFLEINIY